MRRDFDAVNQRLSGAIPIYVVLEGDGPGTFREPAALRAIETLKARADAIPGVSRTAAITDTLRVMNRAIEGDDPAAERIPDDRAAVTELFQLAPKDESGALREREPVARESGGANGRGGIGLGARPGRAISRRCCARCCRRVYAASRPATRSCSRAAPTASPAGSSCRSPPPRR